MLANKTTQLQVCVFLPSFTHGRRLTRRAVLFVRYLLPWFGRLGLCRMSRWQIVMANRASSRLCNYAYARSEQPSCMRHRRRFGRRRRWWAPRRGGHVRDACVIGAGPAGVYYAARTTL